MVNTGWSNRVLQAKTLAEDFKAAGRAVEQETVESDVGDTCVALAAPIVPGERSIAMARALALLGVGDPRGRHQNL